MEDVTLYTGECAAVMREHIPDDSIDLTVTSPPYDNLRTYRGFVFDFEAIAQQLWRVTKPGGVVVWIVVDETVDGSETGTSFRQALRFMEIGFKLHDTMIYQKAGVSFPDTNRYYQNFEYMFVLGKGNVKTFNLLRDRKNLWAGEKVHSTVRNADGTLTPKVCIGNITQKYGVRYNVWRIAHNLPGRADHPASFPESLAGDHIASWSNPGDLVLDPMMGSGTTGKMAVILQRRFIGIDIAIEYVELARERIRRAQLQPPLITLPDNKEIKLTRGETRDDLETSRTEPQWSGSLFPDR